MARLHCPVPGCPAHNFRRQTDVNTHLCDDHHINLERQHGGNMNTLRQRQQQQFSSWLEANGHPNVSIFAAPPVDQPARQQTNENNRETEQKAAEDTTDSNATISTESYETNTQVNATDELEDLLQTIETTDDSGLDVRPNHSNDTHTVVCEDGTLSLHEDDDEE